MGFELTIYVINEGASPTSARLQKLGKAALKLKKRRMKTQ